jgi:hypothetical protein
MAYSNFYGRFYAVCSRAGSALEAVWYFLPSRWYFAGAALLQAIAWFEAFFIYRNLADNLLVLHYNVDFGIDLVGAPSQIFWYPLLGLGILALNTALAAAWHQHKDFRTFVHFLLAAAILFGLFLNLVLLFIYLINFR